MSVVLACAQGHQWKWDDEATIPSPPRQPRCPTCGEPGLSTRAVEGAAGVAMKEADTELPDAPTLPRDSRAPALRPRITIPGYEILEELGRGGMSVVYRARDTTLGRDVAIKLLLSGVYAHVEERTRFLLEGKSLAGLQHANIIQIHGLGEQDGMIYLVLEYAPGGSLARLLRQQVLSPLVAAELIEVLARAVQYAHDNGILHRDLKPANILLSQRPWGRHERSADRPAIFSGATPSPTGANPWHCTVKIADFGLARREDGPGLTRSGDILGTPAYMAPEQSGFYELASGPEPTADVYSLGAILYEALTGRPPFRGETAIETIDQLVHREPAPPRQLQPNLPRDLETICLKCLEKHPGRRYATAALLAEDLQRFREHRPILARPVGRFERLARWTKRNPWPAGLSAALLVAVLGGLTLVLWQWSEAVDRRAQAERAERKAVTRAEAEAHARDLAERAQRDTALAVDYLTDTYGRLLKVSTARKDEALRAEALRSCEQAAELTERLMVDHPSASLRSAATKVLTHLSVLRAAAGQRDQALTSSAKALDIMRDLSTDESPGFPSSDWGETCFVLGGVFLNLDRPADGIVPFTQAVRHFRRQLDASPSDAKARRALSDAYFHLAEVQRRAGRIEASATTTWNRLQLWPQDANQIFDAACELARCVAVLGTDTEQQAEARERFATVAVETLHKAVAAGFKDVKGLKEDKDLAPLHGRADFQKLVAELEKK